MKRGELSTDNAYAGCINDTLDIRTYDNGRFYIILPSFEKKDSYTFDFTFSFDKDAADNGSLSVILTCRGNEPTNITSVVIRAIGSVDHFSELDDTLASAIRAGEKIRVKIPIENNVLHKIIMETDGKVYEIDRDSIVLVNVGDMGFISRNAPVYIHDIYIVNGVGYETMLGKYATDSYATDTNPAPGYDPDGENVIAPPTYDISGKVLLTAILFFVSAIVIYPGRLNRKKE